MGGGGSLKNDIFLKNLSLSLCLGYTVTRLHLVCLQVQVSGETSLQYKAQKETTARGHSETNDQQDKKVVLPKRYWQSNILSASTLLRPKPALPHNYAKL